MNVRLMCLLHFILKHKIQNSFKGGSSVNKNRRASSIHFTQTIHLYSHLQYLLLSRLIITLMIDHKTLNVY